MVFPDFIIGGAQKSGTTTLLRQLQKHPSIYAPRQELHFFASRNEEPMGTWELGIEWYRRQFPDHVAVTGEKTPNYLYNPRSPQRIYDIIPGVKLIFILRNPVDRAYSQYIMKYRNDGTRDYGSFEKAIQQPNCEYLERGIYWKQLERYQKLFHENQMLILVLDELKNNPKNVYHRIYDFLNVAPIYPADINKRYYRGGQPRYETLGRIRRRIIDASSTSSSYIKMRLLHKTAYAINMVNIRGQFMEYVTGKQIKKYPPMNPKTRAQLHDYFLPHNQQLLEMYPDLPIRHWIDGGGQ
ncbi:MAG: sulfotransferase family protein [Thermoplasmatota archaeon]